MNREPRIEAALHLIRQIAASGADVERVVSGLEQLSDELAAPQGLAEADAQRNLFHAVLDHLAEGVVVTDRSDTLVYANPAARRRFARLCDSHLPFEWLQNSVLRTDMKTRITPEEIPRSRALRGEPSEVEFYIQPQHGTEGMFVHASGIPIRDARGEVVLALDVLRDITVQQRVAFDHKSARESAEAASRAKADFLANMSHEIRTPLNGVIGMAELLASTPLTHEQREYLRAVQTSAGTLLDVIGGILDFSKIEAGRMDIERRPFDVRCCVEDAIRIPALQAHQKGLELCCSFQPGVPVVVIGDAARLKQVLVNLVGNAVKFTKNGEVIVEVGVERWMTDEVDLHVVVRDTGIGIPEDKQAIIFESFTQVDTSITRRFGGTGLGLAISSRLVSLMGGRLWVVSELHQGSEFHFTARCGIGESPARTELVSVLVGMTALVVNDNATYLEILRKTLERWGMVPSAAGSASAAMLELRRAWERGTPFPLVLFDAHMRGADGYSFAQSIRSDLTLSSTVLIMLSSGAHPGDGERYASLGVHYLTKPVKQSELLDTLLAAILPPPTQEFDVAEPHPASMKPLSVLLAEDNPVNRLLATRMLEKRGHRVVVAANGAEALTALRHGAFDVALMDVQMPEMSGLEAAAAIRLEEEATGSHLPIIALTAHAMKSDREQVLASGMDAYVPKPVRATELFNAITAVTRGRSPSMHPKRSIPASRPRPPAAPDRQTMLASVDNDMALLRELTSVFLHELPELVGRVRRAVVARDAGALDRAAHHIKGALGNFGAARAVAAAQQLERMGRCQVLDDAEPVLEELEAAIQALESALREVTAL